jgi:hypothetical protein
VTGSLAKPALITHAFFQAARVGDAEGPAARMWAAVRGMGFDEVIAGGGWPLDLALATVTAAPGRLTMIGGAQRPVPDGISQAVAYQMHDVVGISVLQATDETSERTWADLRGDWFDDGSGDWPGDWPGDRAGDWPADRPGDRAADRPGDRAADRPGDRAADRPGDRAGDRAGDGAGPTAGTLGVVTIHLAVVTDRPRAQVWSSTPEEVAAAFDPADLPDWGRSWWRPAKGLLVWELSAPAHPVLTRRLLAVTSAADEDVMDDWFWGGPEQSLALPPFTSYLMHAAKLRYERVVLDRDLEAMGTIITDVDRRCAELVAVLDRPSVSIEDILGAERALHDLRWRQHGLTATVNAVRDMTGTVNVAQANMRSALGGAPSGSAASPIETDRRLARWTQQQLRVQQSYLASAQTRAGETKQLAATIVDEALQHRRERLATLQTAVIGAILTTLAGIQSVEYKVTWLPGPLVAPTIFGLAALALVLPSVVLRWPRGGHSDSAFTWFDIICAALFGATAGWFTATAAARHAAEPRTAVLSAIAGALIAAAAAATALFRKRR